MEVGSIKRCKVGRGTERKGEVECVRNGRGAVERKERGKKPDRDDGERQGRGQRALNDL